MKQLSLFSQSATLARAGAEGRVYVKGADLYYGDTSGTEIRLTAAGQPVNGGSVTIVTGGGTYSSPTSTLGDLIVRGASADLALPVGTDTYVLTADSSDTTYGVKWSAPGSSSGIATGAVLPTAGSGYRATLFMLEVSGQPDRLYCCGLKADGSTYEWRELVIFGP